MFSYDHTSVDPIALIYIYQPWADASSYLEDLLTVIVEWDG